MPAQAYIFLIITLFVAIGLEYYTICVHTSVQ